MSRLVARKTGLYARLRRFALGSLALALLLALWWALLAFHVVPQFLLPSPLQVLLAFIHDAPLLWMHTQTTLVETALGLIVGLALGVVMALLMDACRLLDDLLSPLITLSQTIPAIAIAPLLVLWLGYGIVPKVVLVVLTTFFPVAIATLAGLKDVDPDMLDLFKVMGATRWQTFYHLRFWRALPHFFSGLKISTTYALISAVIAEWLGGFSGLGVYMTRVRKSYAYDRMFAVIILISVLSLLLIALVRLIERASLRWKNEKDV